MSPRLAVPTLLCLALVPLAAPVAAQTTLSGPAEHPAELARVTGVVANRVWIEEARRQCTVETREVAAPVGASVAGTIVGALAGAALGSRAGKGTGQVIATSAGASIGAELGARAAAGAPRTESVEVCRTMPIAREVVRDYTVRYEWHGREYAALMSAPPADGFLRIESSHRPGVL